MHCRSFVVTVCLLAVGLYGAQATAQETSVITGTVADALTQKPLGDVVVTASSPALQRERTAVTDATGLYRLSQLPPGTYSLRLERQASRSLRAEVHVGVDRTIRLNLQVPPRTAESQEVVVVTSVPTVDVVSAAQGISLGKDFIDRVALVRPNATGQRTFEDLAAAAPQVSRDQLGYGFNGGQSSENLYLVDGLQVNDPAFGTLKTADRTAGIGGAQLPLEFLEAANVTTGGFLPEFGRASGGVLNVVTKSGTNEFHGSFWGNWWPGALTATPRVVQNDASSIELASARHNTFDFGFDLGGPIVKDRLWFYVGVAPSIDRQRTTRGVRAFQVNGEGSDFLYDDLGAIRADRIAETSRFDDRRSISYLAKLSWLAATNHTLSLSVSGTPQERTRPLFEPLGANGERRATNSTLVSAKYSGSFLDKALLVDVNAGWNRTDHSIGATDGSRLGTTTGFAGIPQTQYRRNPPLSIREFEDLPADVADRCEPAGFVATRRVTVRGQSRYVMACPVTGPGAQYTIGGLGFLETSQSDRLQARASVSYLFQALGHHVARAGIDLEWTRYAVTRAYSGGAVLQDTPEGGYQSLRDTAYLAGPNERVQLLSVRAAPSQFTSGLFVQDSWNILDAVTLNAGLRYDTQQIFGADRQLALSLNNMLSPRVGLVYDFTQQGRGKVFANYAVSHQNLPLQLGARALAGESSTRTSSAAAGCSPVANPAGSSACTDPSNTVAINTAPTDVSPDAVRVSSGRTLVDPSLQPMAKGEVTAGFEYEVFANTRLGLVGTHNWLFNVIEELSNDEGATSFIGNPGSGLGQGFPKAERKYFGGTLYVTRAFSDGWLAQGSYTLAGLYGNDSGLVRSETGQLDPGPSSDFSLKSVVANRTGFLPADRTHAIKAWVSKDFRVSSQVTILAGLSYEGFSGTPISYLAAHPQLGAAETFVFARGAAGRTPWTHNVNLRAGVTWRISKDHALQFSVDVFNLLNLQEATEVSQELSTRVIVPANAAPGKEAEAACLAQNNPSCVSVLKKSVNGTLSPVTTADLNSNFKQATAYQQPLSVRLGLKFSF